jgi:hypothetical protein
MLMKLKCGKISSNAILAILDSAAKSFSLPDFVSLDWRYAASRMHCYSNGTNWSLIIEEFTYGFNSEDINEFSVIVHHYSDVSSKTALEPLFFNPIKKGKCGVLCSKKRGESRSYYAQLLSPKAKDIKLRNKLFPVSQNHKEYKKLGIELECAPEILKAEFHLWLADTYRDHIFATERELNIKIPKVLQLEEWLHPNLLDKEMPSDSPTFQQIADVLSSAQPGAYKQSSGNTHWSQRPKG